MAEYQIPGLSGKSVRLDAFAIGRDSGIYGIEMQRRGERMGPKRIAYYQAALTMESLRKGEDYGSLPDRCLVVFFEKGIPGMRDPVEVFVTKNSETNIPFEDGSMAVLVDGSYRGEDELGVLLRDLSESDPDKIATGEIREQMLYFKRGEGRREMSEKVENLMNEYLSEYLDEYREEFIEIGRAEGKTEGRAEYSREIADKMIGRGYSKEQIYDLTGVEL